MRPIRATTRSSAAFSPEAWAALLGVALVVSVLIGASAGAVSMSWHEWASALGDPAHPRHGLLWSIRLPRVFVGATGGAALAVSGVLLQTAVRNPLADAGLLGVSAGAGLAALVAILFFPEHAVLVPIFAFLGGILAFASVFAMSVARASTQHPLRLILSGVALQAVLFAWIALLSFLYADRAPAFVSFTIGSLAGRGPSDVVFVLVPTLLGLGLSLGACPLLDLLLLDDESARSVGLAVHSTRLGAAAVAVLLAAGASSVMGLVGFVGLVVPNAVRLVTGPSHAALIPLSALGGATLVVLADTAARHLFAPIELPVGALLAMIGGPVFFGLVWKKLA